MKLFKIVFCMLFVAFMSGCVAYPATYSYGSSAYVSVGYYGVQSRTYYYMAQDYERGRGRCDLQGYFFNGHTGHCEHRAIHRNGRTYYHRGDINRYPNCDRYYRGHLLPPGRYYCR